MTSNACPQIWVVSPFIIDFVIHTASQHISVIEPVLKEFIRISRAALGMVIGGLILEWLRSRSDGESNP